MGGKEKGTKEAKRRGTRDEYVILRRTLMMRAGIRQEDLAAKWRTSQSLVSQLIGGRCRARRYEEKFAALFGMKHEDLFPPTREEAEVSV